MCAHAARFEVFLRAARAECRQRRADDHFLRAVTPDLLHTRRVPAGGNTDLCEAVLYVYDRFDHRRWIREGSVTSDLSRLVWRAYRTGALDTMGEARRSRPVLGVRAVYGDVALFAADPACIRAGSVPTRRLRVSSVTAALDGELAFGHDAHAVARLGGRLVERVYVALPGSLTGEFVELRGFPLQRPLPRNVRVTRADADAGMITTDIRVRVEFDEDREREYVCLLAVRDECVSSARVARPGAATTYALC